MKKKGIFTIPNILSFLRIVAIPFIVRAYILGKYRLAAGLFLLSSFTDIMDGFIARHFNMISSLGKALDPIADKLTMLSLILCICTRYGEMKLLLVLIAVKEVIMGIEGIIILQKTGKTYSAKWFGKAAAFIIYLIIFLYIILPEITIVTSYIMITVSGSAAFLSLGLYSAQNFQKIKEDKNGN